MPIPGKQLTQLQADLKVHEERVILLQVLAGDAQHELTQLRPDQPDYEPKSQSLKNLLADTQGETALHEMVLKLGHDAKNLAALGEMYDKPDVADQLQNDPKGFTQARGIQLPPGVTITATRPSPDSVVVTAHYQAGRLHIRMQWERDKGFTSQEMR